MSVVEFDNDPMIEMNRALGASIEVLEDDPDYVECIIAL